jgi:hypothetical protein
MHSKHHDRAQQNKERIRALFQCFHLYPFVCISIYLT